MIFKINIRITGCIINSNKYGWLFYFSQINDEALLHSLDNFVRKQLKRFNIENQKTKKFVRTWKEINNNFHTTNYIPNYDLITKEKKEKIIKIYNLKYSFYDIDDIFKKIINREIKYLEKDMAGLS